MSVKTFLLDLISDLAIYALMALLIQMLYNFLASSYGWVEAGYLQVLAAMSLLRFMNAVLQGWPK